MAVNFLYLILFCFVIYIVVSYIIKICKLITKTVKEELEKVNKNKKENK